MGDDDDTVFRHRCIELERADAYGECAFESGQRVFRRVPTCSAMSLQIEIDGRLSKVASPMVPADKIPCQGQGGRRWTVLLRNDCAWAKRCSALS